MCLGTLCFGWFSFWNTKSTWHQKFQRWRATFQKQQELYQILTKAPCQHSLVSLWIQATDPIDYSFLRHKLFGDIRIDNYYWRRRFLGTHWWASKAGPWPPPHSRRRPCRSWTDWCRSNAPETRRRLMPRWCWPKLPCRWGNRLPEGQGGGAGAVQGGAEGQGGGGEGGDARWRHNSPIKFSPLFPSHSLLFSSLFFKENIRENIMIFSFIFFFIFFFHQIFHVIQTKENYFPLHFFSFPNIFWEPNIALG